MPREEKQSCGIFLEPTLARATVSHNCKSQDSQKTTPVCFEIISNPILNSEMAGLSFDEANL